MFNAKEARGAGGLPPAWSTLTLYVMQELPASPSASTGRGTAHPKYNTSQGFKNIDEWGRLAGRIYLESVHESEMTQGLFVVTELLCIWTVVVESQFYSHYKVLSS